MKSITLKEHIAQSKIAVAANKAKGNRHGQILSMLYSDPYHFIEELIQNAEDACARRKELSGAGYIRIVFHDDRIDFLHNGDPFTEADLMAITTFASTTKKGLPGINQIGKFGIGFRSVYGITDSPEIHSGIHHYKINDFEVLEETDSCDTSEFTTLIKLPFKASLTDEFKAQLIENVVGLNPKFLLFLKHTGQVEIVAGNRNIVLTSATESFGKNLSERNIHTYSDGVRKKFRYLLFTRNPGQLKEAAIAFALDESDNIIQEEQPVASVYFPTQFRIAHSVLVHGRFTTTPNRENIPFSNEWTPENNRLLEVIADLMRITLRSLQSEKLLGPGFWNLFAWNNASADPISATITDTLNAFLTSGKCLEGASGKLFGVADLCVAEEEPLQQLASGKDTFSIFSRMDFVHSQLTANENFISFLRNNHKLKLADIDSYAFHIANHPEFLQKKPLSYFPTLFRFLASHNRLWDLAHRGRYYNLRHSAIIPDKKKKLTAPFLADNRPQIFIGTASAEIATVHPELAQDADCMNFFNMLGIPDTAPHMSEADKLMQRFQARTANQWWLKVFEIYLKSDILLKDRIRQKIQELECVPVILSSTGEKTFVKPHCAYISNNNLAAFLTFHPTFFVQEQLFRFFSSHNAEASLLNDFLCQFGVNNGLRVIPLNNTLTDEEKTALRLGCDLSPIVRETVHDFSIEGLDSFLSRAVPSSSSALWQLLGSVKEEFRKASYTFESYVRSETVHFSPDYINKLKEAKWLFDEKMNAVSPQGFSVGKLHPYFQQAHPESLWMAETLGMTAENVTQEEMELLDIIRNNRLNADSLKKLIQGNAHEVTYIQFVPIEQSTGSQKNEICFSDAGALAMSVAGFSTCSQSWDQSLFDDKTNLLKNHLLHHAIANSKTLQAEVNQTGHVELKEGSLVLSNYFAGIRPGSGEPVLLPQSFINFIRERPDRKDVGLFVYNLEDNSCLEVSPALLSIFLKNNSVAFVQTMNLSHD